MALKRRHLEQLLLVVRGILLSLSAIKATSQITKPGCLESCGSISIPYPFGISKGCYIDESFLVICNRSFNPPKLFFPQSDVPIISNISLDDGELRVASPISRSCYDELGNLTTTPHQSDKLMITKSRFPLSTQNKFTAVGCDTLGIIQGGTSGRNYTTACATICNQLDDVTNSTCEGVGCCQMSIPDGVIDYFISASGLTNNHTDVHSFNPCSFSFVAEDYNFSSLDFLSLRNRDTVPVVLDWSVGNETCEIAEQHMSSYACTAANSECLNSSNAGGYRCRCSQGYHGNPYLLDGCRDLDECESNPNPCVHEATCKNLIGSFTCLCPKCYEGDGKRNGTGTGCTKIGRKDQTSSRLGIALGICVGLLVLVVGGSCIYWELRKRKLDKLKEHFFQQNGGILLQQLSQYRGYVDMAKVFTIEELNEATNNYDESRILGQGGYGTVYKGVLADNRMVAIKKSKIGDQSQIEQFINEVIVLSQVNHRNVVKLIGCCLETEVPSLVYEFITNGTLSDHIHKKGKYQLLSWELRLKIATETASALAYLHSSTSMPIIHRDVKAANILLDDSYTAKVGDFGASRLVPLDQTELTTLVQGTLGYLDPEYLHTSQLTEKSDVYSFGVVLAELLTGEKAISSERRECDRNLALFLVSSMKEDRLLQILDNHIVVDDERGIQQVKEVANLAKRCLGVRGEERPIMKEVASELEGLTKEMHPWRQHDLLRSEEAEYLLKPFDVSEDDHGASCSIITAGFDGMKII